MLVAVADAAHRFPIPLDAFGDLVDGAEMDVRGTEYETFAELERYCRRVAGSIGRLALGVFDCSDRERGAPLADDLGVALQIGNILRDLGEDLAGGRVYLPHEDLERFGVSRELEGPVELVVAFEAQRGLEWLDRGLELVPLLDRRSTAAVLAMAGKYRVLLERIADEPSLVLNGRRLAMARVPTGSYNVQEAHGWVVTPSLGRGSVCLLSLAGRVVRTEQVARSSHDACLVVTSAV